MKEKCILLIKTHIWPLCENAEAHGVNLLDTCKKYLSGIEEYNALPNRKYDYEFCILLDGTNASVTENPLECAVHETSVDEIKKHKFIHCKSDAFKSPTVRARKYNSHATPILWYNSEYLLLDYYLTNNSEYEYYWVFEYDVLPVGDFAKYLQAYDDIVDDFLTYNLKYKTPQVGRHSGLGVDKRWWWWGCMSGFDFEEQVGSYLPVNRFSNRAVAELIKTYKAGAHGYCELLIPSVIHAAGMSLDGLWLTSHDYFDDCKLFHKRKELLGGTNPPPIRKQNENKQDKR